MRKEILQYLSDRGSVDGITRKNTLTEDSLDSEISENLIQELKKLVGFWFNKKLSIKWIKYKKLPT